MNNSEIIQVLDSCLEYIHDNAFVIDKKALLSDREKELIIEIENAKKEISKSL